MTYSEVLNNNKEWELVTEKRELLCMVVEDNPNRMQNLKNFIKNFTHPLVKLEVAYAVESSDDALGSLMNAKVDIVYLDMQLKSGHGSSVINALSVAGKNMPKPFIIITTSYMEEIKTNPQRDDFVWVNKETGISEIEFNSTTNDIITEYFRKELNSSLNYVKQDYNLNNVITPLEIDGVKLDCNVCLLSTTPYHAHLRNIPKNTVFAWLISKQEQRITKTIIEVKKIVEEQPYYCQISNSTIINFLHVNEINFRENQITLSEQILLENENHKTLLYHDIQGKVIRDDFRDKLFGFILWKHRLKLILEKDNEEVRKKEIRCQ